MKKLNLKDKSVEEMTKMLAEKREELRAIRFSGMGRTKDASTSKKTRGDVARIMTELGSRKSA